MDSVNWPKTLNIASMHAFFSSIDGWCLSVDVKALSTFFKKRLSSLSSSAVFLWRLWEACASSLAFYAPNSKWMARPPGLSRGYCSADAYYAFGQISSTLRPRRSSLAIVWYSPSV